MMRKRIFLLAGAGLFLFSFSPQNFGGPINANINLANTTNFGMLLGGNIAHSGENFGIYPGDTFDPIKDIGIRDIRIHDSKSFDWDVIFPNWNADPNSPASYDFSSSDRILQSMQDHGFVPFMRLGASVGAVTNIARLGTNPPDVNKWCTIANNIIGHYVNGWGNGHHYNLKYVEIWNEPDIGFWKGDQNKFNQLCRQTILTLRRNYPQLKYGVSGISNVVKHRQFADNLLASLADPNGQGGRVPLDFFSWHVYEMGRGVGSFKKFATTAQQLLDKNGYTSTASICTEYNAFLPSPYLKTVNAAVDIESTIIWAEEHGVDGIYFYPLADNWGLFDIKPNANRKANFVKTNMANAYVLFKEFTNNANQRLQLQAPDDRDDIEMIASKSPDNSYIRVLVAYKGTFPQKLTFNISGTNNPMVCDIKELSGNGINELKNQNVLSSRNGKLVLTDNIQPGTVRLYALHL